MIGLMLSHCPLLAALISSAVIFTKYIFVFYDFCKTGAVCVITPTAVLFRQILHLHISPHDSGMIHLGDSYMNHWLVAIILLISIFQ